MPLYYETIASTDRTTTKTLLNEAIPLTGQIVSGAYGLNGKLARGNETNIKNYTHGMFQSVYDYPYLSSSANHIFDITCGFSNASSCSGSSVGTGTTQNAKKINIYNQKTMTLLGFNASGNIETFESDLSFADDNNQMKEVFFVDFARLLTKDQIQKGSFKLSLMTGTFANPGSSKIGLIDASASAGDGSGTGTSRMGDYGVLFMSGHSAGVQQYNNDARGIIFYQAGLAVLSTSCFQHVSDFWKDGGAKASSYNFNVTGALSGTSIETFANALRHRFDNVSFNNTTEINSQIYFCRIPHNKFNYSSNPTYVTGSKIRVKNIASDLPVSYITTIGLYNSANELLAVAKLSEPLRKDPNNEITLRVRLDY